MSRKDGYVSGYLRQPLRSYEEVLRTKAGNVTARPTECSGTAVPQNGKEPPPGENPSRWSIDPESTEEWLTG